MAGSTTPGAVLAGCALVGAAALALTVATSGRAAPAGSDTGAAAGSAHCAGPSGR
jgi:hypothetical protein